MKNIVLQDICKSYGASKVVNGLSFTVEEGERLILLGPSGCGKSTTLRMIAGLESITSGSLYLGGRLANHEDSGSRNISMVFQNYALYPHMTAQQNITYSLRVRGLKKEEISRRLKNAVEMLQLGGLEKRKPKDLSGGQRQRVALARAIVKQADYILLDEPLSNLDSQLRAHARKELVSIHKRLRQTMVYVTHDHLEAMTMGDKIALLHQGSLQMLDTPANVYHHPANVFTARFIGSPCCNIASARICGSVLAIGGHTLRLPRAWAEHTRFFDDTSLFFGVRPEHLGVFTTPMENSIQGTVKYLEDYGNRVAVFLEAAGMEWVAVVEGDAPQNGETAYLCPDFNHIHLFDKETEASIGYPERAEKMEYEYEPVYQHKFA